MPEWWEYDFDRVREQMKQDFVAFHVFRRYITNTPETPVFAWLLAHSKGPVTSAYEQAKKMRVAIPGGGFFGFGGVDRTPWYIYFATSDKKFYIICNLVYGGQHKNYADCLYRMNHDIDKDPFYWRQKAETATIEAASRLPAAPAYRLPAAPAARPPPPGDPVENDSPIKYNIDTQAEQAEQKKIYDDNNCPTCLAPLTGKANVNVNEGNPGRGDGTCVVLIPCGHMMHRICYNEYVTNPKTTHDQHLTCPLCRKPQTAKAILYSPPMSAAQKDFIQDPEEAFKTRLNMFANTLPESERDAYVREQMVKHEKRVANIEKSKKPWYNPKKYFGGTHTRTKRYSVTRGCRKQTPGKHRRTTMRKRCGKKCF